MGFQVVSPGEGLPTILTMEGLLPLVGAQVSTQVLRACEAIGAPGEGTPVPALGTFVPLSATPTRIGDAARNGSGDCGGSGGEVREGIKKGAGDELGGVNELHHGVEDGVRGGVEGGSSGGRGDGRGGEVIGHIAPEVEGAIKGPLLNLEYVVHVNECFKCEEESCSSFRCN